MKKQKLADIWLLADHTHTKRDETLEAAIKAIGKPSPSVAFIGAASSDSSIIFRQMKKSLLEAGAGRVELVRLADGRSSMKRAREILTESDIIHLSSGDVEKGMNVLSRRNAIPLLNEQREAGKFFFGFSAGSIMLSGSWIRWPDPKKSDLTEAFPCLGFARVFCDTHAETEDFQELALLLGHMPAGTTGYGIPHGAGLVASSSGRVKAVIKAIWRFRKRGDTVLRLDDLEPE